MGKAKVRNIYIMKWQEIRVLLIYGLFVIAMVITISNKKNMHIDDLFSYSLANNIGSLTIDFVEGQTYRPAEELYLGCLAVDGKGGRFQFANVWKNQSMDVHPPLYYLLLHTICSFFPGKFSVWFAGGINIVFALLTLYVWRKIMSFFLDGDNGLVDFSSFLFVLTVGILQNVSFFRMYVMAMFWVTLLAWLFLCLYEKGISWERGIILCVVSIAGALTHYYCIVYLFFTCVAVGIFLLSERRWKDTAALILCMAVAAFDSVRIFPAMTFHMFSGYRGKESVSNLAQMSWGVYWERMADFFAYINRQLLGGWGLAAGSVLFAVWLAGSRGRQQLAGQGQKAGRKGKSLLLLVIPSFLYFLFVSRTASYITDRYLFPVYAVVLGIGSYVLICLTRRAAACRFPGTRIAVYIIGLCLLAGGWLQADWEYLYRSSAGLLDRAGAYADLNCICIYDGVRWKVQNMFYEAAGYRSLTVLGREQVGEIANYGELLGDEFILCVTGVDGEEVLRELGEYIPAFGQYEYVGGFAESVTYHVRAGGE